MHGRLFVELHFTDLVGVLRSVTIVVDESRIDKTNEVKSFFDASSVYGFESIENSDLVLRPIISTCKKIPWNEGVYRCISQVLYSNGERYPYDPRFIAEKTMGFLGEKNLEARVGVEVEFFLFNKLRYRVSYDKQILEVGSIESTGESGYSIAPRKGYCLPEPYDSTASIRREICRYMEELGFTCKKTHHEVASFGQVEVTSSSLSVDSSGDFVQTIKYVAKTVSSKKGYTTVFLAKPIPGDNGNGMHIHVSLWRDSTNLFYDEEGLSQIGRYFIGGLIEHGRSLSAIVSPTVNSYKRLVPGYEAPVYLTWGYGNRSVAVRVPVVNDKDNFRIEYRPPDPTANPYLAVSAIVLAGLDGIQKKIDPGDPVEVNVYRLSEDYIRRHRISSLPHSLLEALEELEVDNEYLKPVFTKEFIEKYIELKKKEAIEASTIPSPSDYVLYNIL